MLIRKFAATAWLPVAVVASTAGTAVATGHCESAPSPRSSR